MFSKHTTQTLKLAMPMAIARLVGVLIGFIGMLLAARLGKDTLAATALLSAIQGLVFVSSQAILTSISICVGYCFGAKKHTDAGSVFQQGLVLALIISVPLMLLVNFAGKILLALGQQPALAQICQSFFNVYIWSITLTMINAAFQQFLLAIERQRIVFYVSISSLIVMLISAKPLMFGIGHFKGFGIHGLAVTYIAMNVTAVVFYMIYLKRESSLKVYQLFKWRLTNNWHYLKRLFTIGMPIAINSGGDLVSFFLLTVMIGWLGNEALQARQISSQYMILLIVPLMAIAQSSGILVSQANGREDVHSMRLYNNISLKLCIALSLTFFIVAIIDPKIFIAVYINVNSPANHSLVKLATILLFLSLGRQLADSFMNVSTGSLRGLFDVKYPMLIGIIARLILYIPLAYFVGFTLHGGVIGMIAIGLVTNLACSYILWQRWQQQLQRKISDFS